MSHFSRIQTRIRDEVLLKEALQRLDCSIETGPELTIKSDNGEIQTVQLVADVGAGADKVGFRRGSDGNYELRADWFRVERGGRFTQQSFPRKLKQAYAHAAVVNEAQSRGYIVEQEEVLESGEIRLVVSEPV